MFRFEPRIVFPGYREVILTHQVRPVFYKGKMMARRQNDAKSKNALKVLYLKLEPKYFPIKSSSLLMIIEIETHQPPVVSESLVVV